MLRGVVPDSFPCQPTALPVRAPGQRRFVVMDDNVHRIYGARVEQVCLRVFLTIISNAILGKVHCLHFGMLIDQVNVSPSFRASLP